MIARSSLLAATAAVILCSGCGGGGSSSSVVAQRTPQVPQPVASSNPSTSLRATATIFIPSGKGGSSAGRRAQWVSPATSFLSISAVRSDGYTDNTSSALTNCTTVPGGRTCQIPFDAPTTTGSQSVTITVWCYDTAGWLVSQGALPNQTVTSQAANAFAFVLDGIIGQTPAIDTTNLAALRANTAATVALPYAALDNDGNAIAGPLDVPLTVTLSGTGSFTFVAPPAASGATVSANGTVLSIPDTSKYPGSIQLAYNGQTSPLTTITIGTQSTFSLYYTLLSQTTTTYTIAPPPICQGANYTGSPSTGFTSTFSFYAPVGQQCGGAGAYYITDPSNTKQPGTLTFNAPPATLLTITPLSGTLQSPGNAGTAFIFKAGTQPGTGTVTGTFNTSLYGNEPFTITVHNSW